MSVPSQEYEQSCICVLGISVLSLVLRLLDWILELSWKCGILFFIFFVSGNYGSFFSQSITVLDYSNQIWAAMIVWQLDLQLPVQSVPITTKVVSSNPTHGEVYSIQHYVIKVCQWFSLCTQASSNKIHCHDITEQLLKVALNIINLTPKKLKHRFKMLPMYF